MVQFMNLWIKFHNDQGSFQTAYTSYFIYTYVHEPFNTNKMFYCLELGMERVNY